MLKPKKDLYPGEKKRLRLLPMNKVVRIKSCRLVNLNDVFYFLQLPQTYCLHA